jgi:hypothetical protein
MEFWVEAAQEGGSKSIVRRGEVQKKERKL